MNRFIVLLLLIGIAVAMLVIQPAERAADYSPGIAASNNESPRRTRDGVITDATVTIIDSGRGRQLFLRDCAGCHGERGDGISPIADTLHPRPLDLTSFELADSFILKVLHEGVPGSDMPAWHSSAEENLRAVATYVASLARRDTLSPERSYASPEALQEAGRRVYLMHCTACHGEKGGGDGPEAGGHLPMPASFTEMRPSYAAAERVIENGVQGTAMPAWPLLTPAEIQAVTFYIRSLYVGSKDSTGVQP